MQEIYHDERTEKYSVFNGGNCFTVEYNVINENDVVLGAWDTGNRKSFDRDKSDVGNATPRRCESRKGSSDANWRTETGKTSALSGKDENLGIGRGGRSRRGSKMGRGDSRDEDLDGRKDKSKSKSKKKDMDEDQEQGKVKRKGKRSKDEDSDEEPKEKTKRKKRNEIEEDLDRTKKGRNKKDLDEEPKKKSKKKKDAEDDDERIIDKKGKKTKKAGKDNEDDERVNDKGGSGKKTKKGSKGNEDAESVSEKNGPGKKTKKGGKVDEMPDADGRGVKKTKKDTKDEDVAKAKVGKVKPQEESEANNLKKTQKAAKENESNSKSKSGTDSAKLKSAPEQSKVSQNMKDKKANTALATEFMKGNTSPVNTGAIFMVEKPKAQVPHKNITDQRSSSRPMSRATNESSKIVKTPRNLRDILPADTLRIAMELKDCIRNRPPSSSPCSPRCPPSSAQRCQTPCCSSFLSYPNCCRDCFPCKS